METTPNSQNFPQFMQAETVSEVKAVSKTEIADFRFNPAVQNRPAQILNIEKEENGIVLTLGTIARRAMLSYTHETSLHLYKPADITIEKVYLHIALEKRLSYFSRYDNIEGGIIQLDPDRYSSGKGKVFFSNDKPFVTVGFSLWYPSGNPDDVTKEWLKEQADIINAKKADLSSINGYTVINIHPWTIGTDDLQYFISQLDDNIEIIGIDELLSAVKQNIPHEFAQPE